jgi:hypothetical protein
VKYVRRNFVCGLRVLIRWDMDRFATQPLDGRPAYPYRDDELRKVARDAYVVWQASRYSAPWQYAGEELRVREQGPAVAALRARSQQRDLSRATRSGQDALERGPGSLW